jgi:hypothetical protein
MVRVLSLTLVLAAGLLAGCSRSDEPKRFQISGEAFFDGKPIPYGDVLFTPDGAKGNSGPQGIAHIRDGKFSTADKDGKGIAGGHTVIRVTGLTAQGGKVICEVEMNFDFPKSDTTHKIEVPKSAEVKTKNAPPEI